MYYAGIDLHRNNLVVFLEGQFGAVSQPRTFLCAAPESIREFFAQHRPFRAVIEATCNYRWLYDLLAPLGEVVLAHPKRLRAIAAGRAKTDKLDAALLARLLRAELIPRAYVPPAPYDRLRDLTRARARIVRHQTQTKNELHALLARYNVHPPFKTSFGKRWKVWVTQLDLGMAGAILRDEMLRRIAHFQQEIERLDEALEAVAPLFPQIEALLDIRGIGRFTALLIVAEIGEPWRFANGKQVGAYAGLTARVNQSGGHCYHGHITRQGSGWLRWGLVQVAMKVTPGDAKLRAM